MSLTKTTLALAALGFALSGGATADLDLGAEAVAAGFAKPAVADAAIVHEGGPFRHELLMVALRAKRPGEITGEGEHRGRSILERHSRPPGLPFSRERTVDGVCGDNETAK